MARKARVEAQPAKGELSSIVAAFREAFPDEWEAIRLCPLEYGLEVMAGKLKG